MPAPDRPSSAPLTPGLLARAYLFLGSCQAIAAMAAFFFVLFGAGWQWGESLPVDTQTYRQATTACLTGIVLMQIVNVHLCRSEHRSAASLPPFSNRLITAGIATAIVAILLIDYTTAGNALFGTAPIEPSAWLIVIPFAIAMVLLEEARKSLVRSWVRRRSGLVQR